MRFNGIPVLALLSASLVLPFSDARAATITYSTYQAWASNVTNPIELDFTKINSTSGDYSTSQGKTLLPVSGAALPFVFTGPLTGGGYRLKGAQYTSRNLASLTGPINGTGTINIALPSDGQNAFLLGLGSTGSATSINVSLSDGQTFSIAASPNATELFGVSLSHKVSSITISTSSQAYIADFYFASSKLTQDVASASQPTQITTSAEGSTWIMLIGGCLSLFGVRRFYPPVKPA